VKHLLLVTIEHLFQRFAITATPEQLPDVAVHSRVDTRRAAIRLQTGKSRSGATSGKAGEYQWQRRNQMGVVAAWAIVIVGLLGFAAFNLWLRHQRRLIVHRERIAAIEKGIELPAAAFDTRTNAWNVQRILLLAGLCWIAVGLATLVVLESLITNVPPLPPLDSDINWYRVPPVSFIPRGAQTFGLLPLGLGIAHLAVYFVDRKKQRALGAHESRESRESRG
jgi:hypothetical protein